jgi:hypothetical protein
MAKRLAGNLLIRTIALSIGGGLLLAIARLYLPLLFAVTISFAIALVAFARIFMALGALTLRRDLLMFVAIGGALLLADSFSATACAYAIAPMQRCTPRYVDVTSFVSCLGAAMPIAFFWSWVRFRLWRDHLAGRTDLVDFR